MNGNLLFLSPTLHDAGTYQCAAENAAGKAFSTATLLMPRKMTKLEEDGEEEVADVAVSDARVPRKQGEVFLVYPAETVPAAAVEVIVPMDATDDGVEDPNIDER